MEQAFSGLSRAMAPARPLRMLGAALLICAASSGGARAEQGPPIAYQRIPEGAFSIVAQIRAKPGKEAELRAATLPLIEQVRGDPTTLAYFLQEDRAAPGHFIFYEIFANEADFEAHNAQPYVKAWFEKLPELATGGVEVMKMRVLAAPPSSRK